MLKKALLIVSAALLTSFSVTVLDWVGYFQHTYNHTPGQCRKLQGLEYGSEDIQVLPNGIAFISSGIWNRNTDVYKNRPGRIYTFDFNKPDEPPRELTIKSEDKDFKIVSPHGLSAWVDPVTEEVSLFVISHVPTETVDRFHYDADTRSLTHMRRITGDPNFHSLNDLVAVNDEKFFFTNSLYYADWLEFPLGLRWASLGYFDGSSSKLVDTGLSIANGITVSPDRKFLYVAQLGLEDIRVYKLHRNNTITYQHSIQVNTKPDNLDVDAKTGDLWFAAHPAIYKAFRYFDNPAEHSPSQVMRVKLSANGKATSIEEMFSDDGSTLSCSSVSVVYGNKLLIGSVSGPALYCRINA